MRSYGAITLAAVLAALPVPASAFSIWKIETTQGIQILDWWGPCSAIVKEPATPDPCLDNMLLLVEGKATAVRVFFEGASRLSKGAHISGHLDIRDPKARRVVARIPAHNGSLRREELLGFKRHETDNSLNFRIPAEFARGRISIAVSVRDADSPRASARLGASRSLQFHRVVLPVRGVLATFRPSAKFNAPNVLHPFEANFHAALDWASKVLPARVDLVGVDRIEIDLDQTVARLGLPSSIGADAVPDIMSTLATEYHAGLGRREMIYMVYPAAVLNRQMGQPPTFGLEGGGDCSSFGASSGTDDAPPATMAHELGHMLGMPHSIAPPPGGGAVHLHEDYPRVSGTPDGSILSEGFDVDLMAVVPKETMDIMHYRVTGTRWVGTYSFVTLVGCIRGR